LQYTIEYLVLYPRLFDGINDERAAQISMPLMKPRGYRVHRSIGQIAAQN
jgi:hypothetical protein